MFHAEFYLFNLIGGVMIFIRKNIYSFVFFIAIIVLGLFFPKSYASVILAILIYFYIGRFVEDKSSIHMMFFLGYSIFIFLPSLLNWYYLDVDLIVFYITSLVAAFFLFLTRDTKVKEFICYGFFLKLMFLALSFLAVIFVFLGFGYLITPVFAFLIMLLSLCFQQNKLKNNFIYMFVFFIVFIVYLFFYWSGFGRTVVVGWLLLAMLQFAYSISFKINKYVFGLVPGLAATLFSSRDLFQLRFTGFERVLNDSAYGPYRLASSFIGHFNQRGFDLLGFWDQIVFTFFVYIPRAIWPSKPNGFGLEYTIRHLDAYLADAGHSVAATLIGDHIYFMGYFGIITAMMVFLVIAFAVNALYRIKGLNGNGVLVFSASMMVLVWGGMTSFSARVALPSIVFVLLFILFRRFLTRRTRIVWGASL